MKLDREIGKTYGRLTILERTSKKDQFGNYIALCICSCGQYKESTFKNLKSGDCKSCGCLKYQIENLSSPKLYPNIYRRWVGIRKRCLSPYNASYCRYKDIEIDPLFLPPVTGFEEFKTHVLSVDPDAENKLQSTKIHIDRKDNTKGYVRGNIRLVTVKENCRNRKTNLFVVVFGERMTVSEAVECYNPTIDPRTAASRVRRGWNHEWAIILPKLSSKITLKKLKELDSK